jgi:putative SOS response-associated peptidase YedK
LFAFAGLWERWRNPTDGSIVRSFTIVTAKANDRCRPIHDRMPVILPPQAWSMWLGESEFDSDALLALLHPCASESVRVYPVSTAVGNVKNDGPALLDAVAADLTP